jgi:hypothetical protein
VTRRTGRRSGAAAHGVTEKRAKVAHSPSATSAALVRPLEAGMGRGVRGDAPSWVPSEGPKLVNRTLVDLQTTQRCRICDHVKQYCNGINNHVFAPVVTCESCIHMGRRYWGSDDMPVHFCNRSDERRAAAFTSTGDRVEDFMQEFRRFYDAGPRYTNCGRFFEPKSLPQAQASRKATHDGASPPNPNPSPLKAREP